MSQDHPFDTIGDEVNFAASERRWADFGAICARYADAILVALAMAANVQEQGLRADLECGHVVPEDDAVQAGEDGPDICKACYREASSRD